jgi:hypothetical protein
MQGMTATTAAMHCSQGGPVANPADPSAIRDRQDSNCHPAFQFSSQYAVTTHESTVPVLSLAAGGELAAIGAPGFPHRTAESQPAHAPARYLLFRVFRI